MRQRPFKIIDVKRIDIGDCYDFNDSKSLLIYCSANPTDDDMEKLKKYLDGWIDYYYQFPPIYKINPSTLKSCGECHIKPGEICDICGVAGPPKDTPLFDGMTLRTNAIDSIKMVLCIALVLLVGFLILTPIFYFMFKGSQ